MCGRIWPDQEERAASAAAVRVLEEFEGWCCGGYVFGKSRIAHSKTYAFRHSSVEVESIRNHPPGAPEAKCARLPNAAACPPPPPSLDSAYVIYMLAIKVDKELVYCQTSASAKQTTNPKSLTVHVYATSRAAGQSSIPKSTLQSGQKFPVNQACVSQKAPSSAQTRPQEETPTI